jgi:Ser/Thr protein kinase RdoA (MazF antagonist)
LILLSNSSIQVTGGKAMNATVKAHGMDGTLVTPDWPPLTLDEVRTVLAEFPAAGEPETILFASPRPFSAAAVVCTDRKSLFLKRHHHAVRDGEGLREEHRFLAHLLAHGAPVPRVLANCSGDSAKEMGEWTYEVHEAAEGVDVYRDALSWTPFRVRQHARAAGAALARLHRAAQDFSAPRRKVRPLVAGFTIFASDDPNQEMKRYLESRPALAHHKRVRACAEQALELLTPFHAQLIPLLPALEPLWTHNDFHASNLFWSDVGKSARLTAVIDFGLADRTHAVHDLAHAIERNIVEWLELVKDPAQPENVPVHLDHLRALLEGYDSVRPLSGVEAAALAPMTALCHAEFALSEADYFLSVLDSEEQARMAYDGWLVGHARWFRGAGGRRLHDAIARWAETRAARKHAAAAR